MKPTRKIVKQNVGLWKTKRSVWFQKNDDDRLGNDDDFEDDMRQEILYDKFKILQEQVRNKNKKKKK